MASAARSTLTDISTLHWAAVRKDELTILDLFDTLPWFKGASDWTAWRAFLCAIYGLPMTEREYQIFRNCTGRKDPPKTKVREAWVAVGRRGRKSAVAATIAVFEGAYHQHGSYLAPGERARIPIISKDKDDAVVVKAYAAAILAEPTMSHLVQADPTGENIALVNACDIRVKAASISAGRSRTIPAALYDELAFWPNEESAMPDKEIIAGVTPAMANVPHPIEIGMSSPYARRGLLYEKYEDLWAQDAPRALFWKAPTLAMHDNPTIRLFVETEYANDPENAQAEVGAEFRKDVAAFVSLEVIEAVTPAVTVRPYKPGHMYFAFVDPSGGSSDSFTLAISHWEYGEDPASGRWLGGTYLDFVREWTSPFEPKQVVVDVVEALNRYQIKAVTADHYAAIWIAAIFRELGIAYNTSEFVKNELYRDFLPLLNSRSCSLLAHKRLRAQLLALDRKPTRGGRDVIDHPRGSHDDLANAVAGSILRADRAKPKFKEEEIEVSSPQKDLQDRMTKWFQGVKKTREREDRVVAEHDRRYVERGAEHIIGGGGI